MFFNCSKSFLRVFSASLFATSSGSSIISAIGVKSFTNCLLCFSIAPQSYCLISADGSCTCTPSMTLPLNPLNCEYQLLASCAIRTAGFNPAFAAVRPTTSALIDICFITDITFVSACMVALMSILPSTVIFISLPLTSLRACSIIRSIRLQ